MVERNDRPQFGDKLPKGRKRNQPAQMFLDGEDLPLWSGTPQQVIAKPYVPEDRSYKQMMLPDMPGIDFDRIREKDQALRHRRTGLPNVSNVQVALDALLAQAALTEEPTDITEPLRYSPDNPINTSLHAILEAHHLSAGELRRLAAAGTDLSTLLRTGEAPEELQQLLAILSSLLRPVEREQIKSPADAAALLMLEMGHLNQEQLRVVCLDTKNRIQAIHLVYQGSLNASMVRVVELFREPMRRNSAAMIMAHNHPSSDPTPSPEDVALTREVVAGGQLLGIDVLDHLVIGQGRWLSMKEKHLM